MKNIAYYNGKTVPIEEMMVPMKDVYKRQRIS